MKQYRVYNYVNLGSGEVHYIPVQNPAEGIAVIDALANYQLTLDESFVYSNAFGLEDYDETEQEWFDWMDDDGFQEDDYRNDEQVKRADLWKMYYRTPTGFEGLHLESNGFEGVTANEE